MHWLYAILDWHRENVLGNVVASLEMGGVLILCGRPLWRRVTRHLVEQARHHLEAQVAEQITPLHRRFDELWGHLIGVDDDPPDPDSPP